MTDTMGRGEARCTTRSIGTCLRAAAAVLVVPILVTLAGCGQSSESQTLCGRLDVDRQEDPALMAVQIYGQAEWYPSAADDIRDACPQHAVVADYFDQSIASIQRGLEDMALGRPTPVEPPIPPPPGYGAAVREYLNK